MRVAVTLEQCWHRVPGGTARATLDTVAAVAAQRRRRAGGGQRLAPHARRPRVAPVRPGAPPAAAPARAVRRLAAPAPPASSSGRPAPSTSSTPPPMWPPPSRAPWWPPCTTCTSSTSPSHFTPPGRVRCSPASSTSCGPRRPSSCARRRRPGPTARRPGSTRPAPRHAVGDGPPAGGAGRGRRACAPRTGSTDRIVLFVGTVEPRKNLARLLEAFGRLGDVDVDLVIVGPEGWSTDAARHPGPPPGLRAGRRPATRSTRPPTVVCYPSLREGFGLPVLEAMVQGAADRHVGHDVDSRGGRRRRPARRPPRRRRHRGGHRPPPRRPGPRRPARRVRRRARAATFTWARTAEPMVDAYARSAGRRPT